MPAIKYKKKTYAGGTFPVMELTKAAYNALPEVKKMDGTVYMITDDDGGWEAERSTYDNTASGLTATNVQDALDETNQQIVDCKKIYIHTGQQVAPNSDGTFSFTLSALIGKMPNGTKLLFTGGAYGSTSVSAWCTSFDNSTGYVVGQATTGSAFRFDLIVLAPI